MAKWSLCEGWYYSFWRLQFIPRDEINSLKGARTQFFLTTGYENAFHSDILNNAIFREIVFHILSNIKKTLKVSWNHLIWRIYSHGKNFPMLALGRKINAEKISSNHIHALENSSHGKNFSMLCLGNKCVKSDDFTKFWLFFFILLRTQKTISRKIALFSISEWNAFS